MYMDNSSEHKIKLLQMINTIYMKYLGCICSHASDILKINTVNKHDNQVITTSTHISL